MALLRLYLAWMCGRWWVGVHAKTNYRLEHYYCAASNSSTCWFNRARNIFGRGYTDTLLSRECNSYIALRHTHTHTFYVRYTTHCVSMGMCVSVCVSVCNR